MAVKDTLDHGVLGSFSSRIAPPRSGRAAENIAYGYDRFEKTLAQWICLGGTSQESPASQRISRRCRQCKERYLASHLLGDGDRGRIRAVDSSRRQKSAAGDQKKNVFSNLPSQTPRYLPLIRYDAQAVRRRCKILQRFILVNVLCGPRCADLTPRSEGPRRKRLAAGRLKIN